MAICLLGLLFSPLPETRNVGLYGAVLVDATLIRGFVVPVFMSIAGRWNWYPGRGQPPNIARRSPIEDSEPSDIYRS